MLPRPIFVFVLAFLALVAELPAKRFNILVNAEANEEYLEKAEQLSYQTYHFVKGEFFGGATRDPGLEKTQFEELAGSIAEALKKRDLYSEPDPMKGDLLIMVSWGRTALDPDYRELMGIQSYSETLSGGQQDAASNPSGGPGAEGSAVGTLQSVSSLNSTQSLGAGRNFATAKARNIRLLGLENDLEPEFFTTMSRDSLWDVLDEERYFIILNAFDYQHLLEKKELKQVWRVRYNTRAVGLGFKQAYESMNYAVSGVIGLNTDEVTKVKGDTKGRVTMGELEVISQGEELEE